jgi:hypothetical protein
MNCDEALFDLLELPANFPVVTERIEYSTQPPAVAVPERDHLRRAGRNGTSANGVGVLHDQEHRTVSDGQRCRDHGPEAS